MASTVTFEQVKDEVVRLATERPWFIYVSPGRGSCLYVHGESDPGCIFGHAFLALGIPADKVRECDNLDYGGIGNALPHLGIDATEDQLSWAQIVQSQQDAQGSWGEALIAARVNYPEV